MGAYSGWLLVPKTVEVLKKKLPADFDNVIAHHVTWDWSLDAPAALPMDGRGPILIAVYGVTSLHPGVQALGVRVVARNGVYATRPDGKLLHVTYSLADGFEANDSNAAMAAEFTERDAWELPIKFALYGSAFCEEF